MILDATTKTIEVVLEGAITTSQCDVTAGYADSFPGGAFLPGEQDTATNGGTAVTAVSAPAANTQRMVNEVRVYNKDTVAHTVTIQLNDNGTKRILQKQTCAVGATILYAPSGGTLISTATTSTQTTTKISASFTADGQIGTIPASAMIVALTLQETAGHSVSVTLGTSSGGSQILTATTVGSSAIVPVPAASLLLQAWTANQNIFIHSAAWGSANVTVNVWYLS